MSASKRQPREAIDPVPAPPDRDYAIHELEDKLLQLLRPTDVPAVKKVLWELTAAHEQKGCDWQDNAFRAVARYLVGHGCAGVWLQLYLALGNYHGLYRSGEPSLEEAWAWAYGHDWLNGNPELVAFGGAIQDLARKGWTLAPAAKAEEVRS